MSNGSRFSNTRISPSFRWFLLLISLLILGMVVVQVAPHIPRLRDFDQTFYPADRYTLAGENPYTAEYIETDQGAPPDFFSPAWLLLILAPFGLLPPDIARAAWILFLVLVTGAGLLHMQAWGFRGLRPLFLILLPWSLIGLLFGQVTPLVFLGAIMAINCLHDQGKTAVFSKSLLKLLFAFLLIGIKPQLGIFIAAPLLLELLWRRDRRLIGLAIFGGILLGLTLLITPPWLISKAITVQKITAPMWKSTLERELGLWNFPLWLAQPVRLFVVGVMGYWVWLQKGTSAAWWSGWLTAVLIITPYTRAYDGVLLLPLIGQLFLFSRLRFALFFLAAIAYTQLPIGELGSVAIPLTAWLLFIPWRGLIRGVLPVQYASFGDDVVKNGRKTTITANNPNGSGK